MQGIGDRPCTREEQVVNMARVGQCSRTSLRSPFAAVLYTSSLIAYSIYHWQHTSTPMTLSFTRGALHRQFHSSGVVWNLVLSGSPNGCVPTDCGSTPRRRTSCGVRTADGVSHLDTAELSVCGALIRPSTSVRDLGVLLESDLSMRRHVAWTVGCCFRQLRLIRSCIKSLPL